MLDRRARAVLAPTLDRLVRPLARLGVSPDLLTLAGLLLGAAAAVAAGVAAWNWALALWLASRLADGLDGPLARVTRGPGDRGGYLDILADFAVYGGFVVGAAVGAPDARVAALVLLATYYVNGTAFLALSSIAERRRIETDDGSRSLNFVGGVTEGTETIVVHSLFCLFPGSMAALMWAFAALVTVTIGQRVAFAWRVLHPGPAVHG